MFCDDAPVSFDAKVNDLIEKKVKEAKTSKMWYDMHSAPRDGTLVLLLIKNSKNETLWDIGYMTDPKAGYWITLKPIKPICDEEETFQVVKWANIQVPSYEEKP